MDSQTLRAQGVHRAGPRVTVRTLTLPDAADLACLMHYDTVLRRDLGWPDPLPNEAPIPDGAAEGFLKATEAWCERTHSVSMAMVGPGGHTIGLISLSHLDLEQRCGKIGYWMGSAYRGQGYATEAFALVVGLARDLGLVTVRATIEHANPASWRLWAHEGRVERERGDGKAVWCLDLVAAAPAAEGMP